jgi:hypothetical protein
LLSADILSDTPRACATATEVATTERPVRSRACDEGLYENVKTENDPEGRTQKCRRCPTLGTGSCGLRNYLSPQDPTVRTYYANCDANHVTVTACYPDGSTRHIVLHRHWL